MTSIVPYARQFKRQLQVSFGGVELVDAERVNAITRASGHRWRERFWTPLVVVLTFLRQILDGNCSCRKAVAMTVALAALSEDQNPVSDDPSAYSQARQKLPRAALENLNQAVVEGVSAESGQRLWCSRQVKIVDGACVTLPDTPELQKNFPQPRGQKAGCGFPVLRMTGTFCWATGCLTEWTADSLCVSELALARQLYGKLARGTVVLGDRFFGSYCDLCMLSQLGLDCVFRLHQCRPTDMRYGTHLGPRDHLLTWTKPRKRPRGVSDADWMTVPETLTVRHVQVEIKNDGFRVRKLELVTTLLDSITYPVDELASLYRDRWMVELNIRSLKTTLNMETLKGQSKEMVLKELNLYQLAYNLIRHLMWRAAASCGIDERRMSFAGTQQRINAFLPYLAACRNFDQYDRLGIRLLENIAGDVLPERPNRIEPRAVKRRPKNYRRLTVPRAEARKMTYFING
jgi:hypothetical protein